MSQARNQRYMKIASACLQALKEVAPGESREEQIQRVYAAIDEAFQAANQDYAQQLTQSLVVLEQIARLGDDELHKARELARAALPQRH
ncbi:hypothetical protein [Balneatrix alpica]|uniref:hypothetical protein n=1 Tax=Balneatrix alpica TaxID=75684 RepID=UPI002738FEE6|nr:hypothetical protein [Balneatrix alpica]